MEIDNDRVTGALACSGRRPMPIARWRVRRTYGLILLSVIAGAFAAPPLAVSQTAPADITNTGGTLELQEILVTAQRRTENIQDVPVSVAAFSESALETMGITRVEDLQQVDSSLNLSSQSGAVIPFIRGIGNIASQTPGNESSVPVYIDDAYFTRLFVPYLSFADNIDHVEVLKGPQGTLFGRNATGGLISITTRDPGQEQELSVKVGYGSQQTLKGQIYASAPITQTLAIDFSLIGQRMGEGFGRNLYDGSPTYYRDFYTIRSKLVWTPTDSTKIKLSGFWVWDNSSIGAVQGSVYPGYTRGLPPNFTQQYYQPPGFYNLNVFYDTEREHRGHGFTLRADQGLGFADFSSITFWRTSHEPWTSEGDHTNFPWLYYKLNVEDDEVTQEFQLKSTASSPVAWIFGLYYLNAHAAYDPTYIMGDAIELGGLSSLVYTGKQATDSRAEYAQATVPIINKQNHITLGVRYTQDHVGGFGSQDGISLATGDLEQLAPNYTNGANFDQITYKGSVDHSFTDTIMAYGSYSRGFKSGVFNLLPLDSPAVKPEIVDAYEAGLKTTLANGRVRLNGALFWNNIQAFQTNIVVVTAGVGTVELATANKARTRGVEFDSQALVTENLSLDASGQYIDAKFLDFPNAPFITPIYTAPYGVLGGTGSVSGFRLPQVPTWKLNLGFDYKIPSLIGKWTFAVNAAYRSGFPWEADNVVQAPSLTLINGDLTFEPLALHNVSIRAWTKNMLNVHYFGNVLTQTGSAGVLASPAEGRTYGVEFGYRL